MSLRRVVAVMGAVAAAALGAPAMAAAGSLAMAAGSPVLGVPDHMTFDVTGAAAGDHLDVITRQGNGPPCAASSFDDYDAYAGGATPYEFVTLQSVPVSGTQTVVLDYTWNAPGGEDWTGSWTVCAWVHHLDNGDHVDAAAGEVVDVRGPGGTLSLTARATPSIGATFIARATGTAEAADEVVRAIVRPTGGPPCAATPDADSGTPFESVDLTSAGPFSERMYSHSVFAKHWGRYLVCAWLTARDSVVATASTTVTHYVRPLLQHVPVLYWRGAYRLHPGVQLRCTPGHWVASPKPRFSYRWLRGARRIAGAHGRRYRVRRADRGHALRCQVTARNPGGRATGPSFPAHVPRR